jgi:hypothetical protein
MVKLLKMLEIQGSAPHIARIRQASCNTNNLQTLPANTVGFLHFLPRSAASAPLAFRSTRFRK